MNRETKKLVLPLLPEQLRSEAALLKAIYILQSPREVFFGALKNTFYYLHVAPNRVQRQFTEASILANTVRFTNFCNSRVGKDLPEMRDEILADAYNLHGEAGCDG